MEEDLQYAIVYINRAIRNLAKVPEKQAIHEVLEMCGAIDERYKEFCSEFDEQDGLPEGTTYGKEDGISIEFYLEADDWHKVSLALRKLG